MTIIVFLARVMLSFVFALAAAFKLARRAGTLRMLREFGLPEVLARPVGRILPAAEMAVAAALLPSATAWWGAAGAVALLGGFLLAIGANLAAGRKPDCHCFGTLASSPIGVPVLVRNAVLALIALFVMLQLGSGGGSDIDTRVAPFALGAVALAVALVEGWLLLQIVAQNGRLLERVDALEKQSRFGMPPQAELPAGSTAPEFSMPDLAGEERSLDTLLRSGKPALLIFADAACGACTALVPELVRWERDLASRLSVVVIASGNAARVRAMFGEQGVSRVLLQREHEVADRYRIRSTPSAVLVLPHGTIGARPTEGPEAIRNLVRAIAGLEGSAASFQLSAFSYQLGANQPEG